MKFQTIISIALVIAVASTAQGLLSKSLVKKKLSSLPYIVPSISGLIQVSKPPAEISVEVPAEPIEVPAEPIEVSEPIIVPEPIVVPEPIEPAVPIETPAPIINPAIYSYPTYYTRPVYYRQVRPVIRRRVYVRNGDSTEVSLGSLLSGIKGVIGNAISPSAPPMERVYYSPY